MVILRGRLCLFFILLCLPVQSFARDVNPEQPETNGANSGIITTVSISFKKSLIDLAKKGLEYGRTSKYVHGAGIGFVATVVAHILATECIDWLFDDEDETLNEALLALEEETKPERMRASLPVVLAAILYGSYYTSLINAEEGALPANLPELSNTAWDTFFLSLCLGGAYTVWHLLRETFSKKVKPKGLAGNIKEGSYQAFLAAVAFLSTYGSTVKLQTMDY